MRNMIHARQFSTTFCATAIATLTLSVSVQAIAQSGMTTSGLNVDQVCPIQTEVTPDKIMQSAYRAALQWVRSEQESSNLSRSFPLAPCFELIALNPEHAKHVFPGVRAQLNRDTPNMPWAWISADDPGGGQAGLLTMPQATYRYMTRSQTLDVFNSVKRDFEPVPVQSRRGLDRIIYEILQGDRR